MHRLPVLPARALLATALAVLCLSTAATTTAGAAEPAGAPARDASFAGVDCADTGHCVAVGEVVGDTTTTPLVETWNGRTWRVVTLPPVAGGQPAALTAVSCAAASRCVAVGDVGRQYHTRAFVAELSGSTWSTSVLPFRSDWRSVSLSDVSCAAADSCVAVGDALVRDRIDPYVPVSYVLTGRTATVVDPAESIGNSGLFGVACPARELCVAVGSIGDSSGERSMSQAFDGSTWRTVPTPARQADLERWDGVDCTGLACIAVGHSWSSSRTVADPVVARLEGGSWTRGRVRLADPAAGGDLADVSCVARSRCTAVGENGPTGSTAPLAAELRGTQWTGAAVGSAATGFVDVSCVSTTCLAVGNGPDGPVAARRGSGGWADVRVAR